MTQTEKTVIGRAEVVQFKGLDGLSTHARIDTGAKSSAISVERVAVLPNGELEVRFAHPQLAGAVTRQFASYEQVRIASSNGQIELRYRVRLSVTLKGRTVQARFTLTDRSSQVYPVLIGRNVIRGKYIVDVEQGSPLEAHEQARSKYLQSNLNEDVTL